MTDHTPSPATDGLREAIEALADEWEARAVARGDVGPDTAAHAAHELRAVLAAHPALLADPAPEAAREGLSNDEREYVARLVLRECSHEGRGGRSWCCSNCHDLWLRILNGKAPADLPVATGVTTEDEGRPCGVENPDYPGEYACTFPKGHGRVPVVDDGDHDGWADHGAPESGAWWSILPAPAPVVSAGDEGVGLSEIDRVATLIDQAVMAHAGILDMERDELGRIAEAILASDWLAVRVAEAGARAGAVLEAAHAAADELDEWDGEASSRLGGCSPGGVVRGEVHEAFGVEIDDCPACAKRADL